MKKTKKKTIIKTERVLGLVTFIFLFFISCQHAENQIQNSIIKKQAKKKPLHCIKKITNTCDSLSSGLIFSTSSNYKQVKKNQIQLRNTLKEKYLGFSKNKKPLFLDSVSNLFSSHLLNNIIPYWYGTPWDFEGHTSIPNHGKIACGYFVSTTMKDMGLTINRYKLAQQNPKNEAKSLAINDSIVIHYINNDSILFSKKLTTLKDGLYFVGLDNHVGYLYKTKTCCYFIHSNYIENRVMIENCKTSEAFDSFDYYITNITGNKTLMYYWLFEKEIKIKTI